MEELEGCLCLALEEEAGSTGLLRLVTDVMAGLEVCPCSVLKQAAGTVSPL